MRLPILPPVGPCRLSRWIVDVGAALAADEPYAELESDKAIMELRAPTTCRLVERCAEEGDPVTEGMVVAVLELAASEASPTELTPTLFYRYLGKPRSR
ncbi:MAG: lipoyl domain-containing protein [Sandaracinaceae bacterium]|nr:lipoyl domain-containing protein [Sandaracinaceae bacterium]